MYSKKSSNSRTQIGKALYVYGFVLIVMVAIAVGGVQQNPMEADPIGDITALDVDVSSVEDVP